MLFPQKKTMSQNSWITLRKVQRRKKAFFFHFFFFLGGNARAQPPFEHSMQARLHTQFSTSSFHKLSILSMIIITLFTTTYGTEAPRLATVGKRWASLRMKPPWSLESETSSNEYLVCNNNDGGNLSLKMITAETKRFCFSSSSWNVLFTHVSRRP